MQAMAVLLLGGLHTKAAEAPMGQMNETATGKSCLRLFMFATVSDEKAMRSAVLRGVQQELEVTLE